MADRRYDDREVGEILKRATEMQSGLAETGTTEGVTLVELGQVAQDIGLDPANIVSAARELDLRTKSETRYHSDCFVVERNHDAVLNDDLWDEIVDSLRHATGCIGQSEITENSREWTGGSDTVRTVLSTTTRLGKTRLKLIGNCGGATALTTAFGLVFGLFASLVPMIVSAKMPGAFSPLSTMAMTAFVIVTCFFGTKRIIRANRNRLGRELERQMNSLVAHLDLNPTLVGSLPLVDSFDEQAKVRT